MSNPTFHLRVIRENLLKAIEGLSIEALTHVPDGYNNHILWNACHMLVTQQLLVYGLSGNQLHISKEFVDSYRKGTRPDDTKIDSIADFEYLNTHLLSSITQLETDLKANIFGSYTEYPTSFGVTLRSTEEAILFNNIHESMHLGYVLAMKHSL